MAEALLRRERADLLDREVAPRIEERGRHHGDQVADEAEELARRPRPRRDHDLGLDEARPGLAVGARAVPAATR